MDTGCSVKGFLQPFVQAEAHGKQIQSFTFSLATPERKQEYELNTGENSVYQEQN